MPQQVQQLPQTSTHGRVVKQGQTASQPLQSHDIPTKASLRSATKVTAEAVPLRRSTRTPKPHIISDLLISGDLFIMNPDVELGTPPREAFLRLFNLTRAPTPLATSTPVRVRRTSVQFTSTSRAAKTPVDDAQEIRQGYRHRQKTLMFPLKRLQVTRLV